MTVKGPIQLRKENAERMASLNDLSPWEKKLREDAAAVRERRALDRENQIGVDAQLRKEGKSVSVEAIPGYSPEGRR